MPIRKPKPSEFTDGLAIRKPTLSLAVSDDDEDVTELTERLGSLKGVARPTLSERLGAVGKPTLSLAVSDDDDDVTELTDGVAAVSVQRQGSFSLSETMTFSSEDLKLRGARGMELSVCRTGLEPRTSRPPTTGDPHATALQCIRTDLLLTCLSLALDRAATRRRASCYGTSTG